MNQEQIIQMAREAGVSFGLPPDAYKEQVDRVIARLERFAALVATHEREACAKVCDALQYDVDAYGATCAEAIRARGNA